MELMSVEAIGLKRQMELMLAVADGYWHQMEPMLAWIEKRLVQRNCRVIEMYQRMIRSTFKDQLSMKGVLSYIAPMVRQQGEAYGLIAMTQTEVSELSVVTTFIWPDYETAKSAWAEYGGKVVDAIRNSGAKIDIQEGIVERAWFNDAIDIKSLNNF